MEGGTESNEELREKRLNSAAAAAVAVRWPIRYRRIYMFMSRRWRCDIPNSCREAIDALGLRALTERPDGHGYPDAVKRA